MSATVGLQRFGSVRRQGHMPGLFPRSRAAESHQFPSRCEYQQTPGHRAIAEFTGVSRFLWAIEPSALRAFAHRGRFHINRYMEINGILLALIEVVIGGNYENQRPYGQTGGGLP